MTNVVAHISPPAAAPLLNFNCVLPEHSPPPPLSLMIRNRAGEGQRGTDGQMSIA